VEPERRAEFEQVSDARRAAWAWRRYVTAARAASAPVVEVRYERLAADPATVASELAPRLDVSEQGLGAALGRVHGASVGRWTRDLSAEQVEDVLAEAGGLLRELGYVT
jgi:hypothetical protein